MRRSDFDWHPDSSDNEHCIVIRHQLGIAVYRNSCDDVVIRQQDEYGDKDHLVYVSKDNVPKVVQALLEEAGFETATGEPLLLPKPEVGIAESKPNDRTAAERQRRYRANKARSDSGKSDRDGDVDRGEPHE